MAFQYLRSDGTVIMGADFDANSHKVINLATPTNANDAARKTDVDAASSAASSADSNANSRLLRAGDTWTGQQDWDYNLSLRVPDPLTDNHAVNKTYFDHHAANTASDARLKTNIRPITNALAKILALRGVKYDWGERAQTCFHIEGKDELGLIAQEVEAILPEVMVVSEKHPSGQFPCTDEACLCEPILDFRGVDYTRLVPVLIEAMKELAARVDALERASRG